MLALRGSQWFTVDVVTYLYNQGEVTYFLQLWNELWYSRAWQTNLWLQSCAKLITWLYCLWCPNFIPCLILHSVLSQSTRWGLIRIDIEYRSLVWRKNGHRRFFYYSFPWKGIEGLSLFLVTFVLPLPSASLMFLICVLIPLLSEGRTATCSPCPLPKAQSRKLPKASMNIKPKSFWRALLTGAYRLLLPPSDTRQIQWSMCIWRSAGPRGRAEKRLNKSKAPITTTNRTGISDRARAAGSWRLLCPIPAWRGCN